MPKRNFRFYLTFNKIILVHGDEYDTWKIADGNYLFLKGDLVVTKIWGDYIMAYERY